MYSIELISSFLDTRVRCKLNVKLKLVHLSTMRGTSETFFYFFLSRDFRTKILIGKVQVYS